MAADPNFPVYPGWETVRLLGRGSFGAVYEIRRDVRGHTERAALKHIRIPQSDNELEELLNDGFDVPSITARFEDYLDDIVREYSLMADMKGCGNVVYCDDVRYVQHDDGIGWDIFIKMELLTPLPRALGMEITETQALKLGADMCSALAFCEKRKLLHRDVKPANIFVAPDGTYKLGDFGIAKTAERTAGGTKTGTFKYMAPEVYNNRPYGARADLYSLGLVLYWLLNERRTPFLPLPPAIPSAREEEEARARRFRGEPIPPPAHGSEALKKIVLKACAFDPEDRYRDAEEMLRDLKIAEFRSVAPVGASFGSPAAAVSRKAAEGGLVSRTEAKPGDRAVEDAGPYRPTAPAAREETVGVFKRTPPASAAPAENADNTEKVFAPGKPAALGFPRPSDAEAPENTVGAGLAPACGQGQSPGAKEKAKPAPAEEDKTVGVSRKKPEHAAPRRGRPRGLWIGAAALALLLLIGFFTIHKWTPATCAAPETCTICGKTRGEALGHDFAPADCEHPEICQVCGAEGAPALGHKWSEPSCTEPEICEVCGEKRGASLGHDWIPATFEQAAVCRRCGLVDESGPKQYDSSPYTAERVREEAQRAADDPHIEYSLTSEDGTRLEVPKDEEFLDFPRKMMLNAGGSEFFDFLPTPGTGHGALGHGSTGEIVLIVATRVSKGEVDENANPVSEEELDENGEPVIYYFAVATDGRAGSNRRTSYFCCEYVGCNGYHEWHQATCVMPESCSKCGATRGYLGDHVWQPATCRQPETCAYCGLTRGGLGDHDWEPATCARPKTCKVCGATEGGPGEHDWEPATCQHPKTCRVCGATEGSPGAHDWEPANCQHPKTCKVCGATEGSLGDHVWEPATCQHPKTCKVCGATEGEKAYHVWEPATCTEPERCKNCGEKRGSALGHEWISDGLGHYRCLRCGFISDLPTPPNRFRSIADR